jgi:hypothetical protein
VSTVRAEPIAVMGRDFQAYRDGMCGKSDDLTANWGARSAGKHSTGATLNVAAGLAGAFGAMEGSPGFLKRSCLAYQSKGSGGDDRLIRGQVPLN